MYIQGQRSEDRIIRIFSRSTEISESLNIILEEITVSCVVENTCNIVVPGNPETEIRTEHCQDILHCIQIRDAEERDLLIDISSWQRASNGIEIRHRDILSEKETEIE